MAADKGVPVVQLDFTASAEPPRGPVIVNHFREMRGWQELAALTARVNEGIALPVPMTREEQSRKIAALQREVSELRSRRH